MYAEALDEMASRRRIPRSHYHNIAVKKRADSMSASECTNAIRPFSEKALGAVLEVDSELCGSRA